MEELSKCKCEACEGGVDPLSPEQYEPYVEQVPGWQVEENKQITRNLQFENFAEAMSFVNKVGDIAEDEGHHPDILIHGWNRVRITLWTHAIGGLSVNDFIVAAKIDRI